LKQNKQFGILDVSTMSRSGIASLEVTRPISLPPTVSGIAEVMIYNNEEKI